MSQGESSMLDDFDGRIHWIDTLGIIPLKCIERVNSRLEGQVCLDRHRVRGLRNVTVHVALCIIAMLLMTVAALRLGVPGKARSIATFGW